jgi:hypothetical protein
MKYSHGSLKPQSYPVHNAFRVVAGELFSKVFVFDIVPPG